MVPALPSVDGRSSDRGEKLDLSLVCCARIHSFRGGLCVLVARRGEVPCTVESFLDGGGGGEGATKRKMRIS